MSENEKKAIFYLKELQYDKEHLVIEQRQAITTILNLVENQQKELNQEKEKNKTLEELLQGRLFELYNYYKDLAGSYQANCISKDKIKAKIEQTKKVYEDEMKPYQREYGLDVTYLNKKEKAELINKRNCLLTQIEAYKLLLEEE